MEIGGTHLRCLKLQTEAVQSAKDVWYYSLFDTHVLTRSQCCNEVLRSGFIRDIHSSPVLEARPGDQFTIYLQI